MGSYRVMVDDNFHYMDEDERGQAGSFATAEEAIAACRKLVDDWLARHHKPGMTADELYDHYISFGDDPFVVATQGAAAADFSAWTYARERTRAICGGKIEPPSR
jgi:hypothetical protein